MGQTEIKYNEIAEVGIFVTSKVEGKGQEGDIIACYRRKGGIGTVNATRYLWILLEGAGIEENFLFSLSEPMVDEFDNDLEKRRYKIDLEDLAALDPEFRIDLARDTNIIYQPYVPVDTDDFLFVGGRAPFFVNGLVQDKLEGRYL